MPVVVQAEARGDERGALLAYLEAQRGGIRRALHHLTEEQARSAPAASELSVAGLLKHVTVVERGWLRTFQGIEADEAEKREEWENSFKPTPEETAGELIAFSRRVAAETERAVRAVSSLDETFTVPPGTLGQGRRLLLALGTAAPDPGVRAARRPRRCHPRDGRRQGRLRPDLRGRRDA